MIGGWGRGLTIGALALVLGACSGGPGGSQDVSEPPAEPSVGTESPQSALTVESLDASAFRGAGEVASIRRLHTVGDSAYAAGTVQALADGHRRPLLLERRSADWIEVALTVPGDAPAVVEEVVDVDGAPVAFGSAVTGEDEDVVAWAIEAPQELLDITGSLVGPGAQTVTAASAGPAGVLLAGHRDGAPVVWYSTDGRDFEELPIDGTLPVGDVTVAVADVAVSGDHALVALRGVDHSVVLTVDGDGRLDELAAGVAGDLEVTVIAPVPGGFVVGGGSGGSGSLEPTVWRTDGQTWPAGETLPVTETAGTSNRGYDVGDLDVGSGRIVASVGFAVLQSPLDADRAWTEVGTDGLAPSTRPDDIASGPPGYVAELVADGRTIQRSDGATWQPIAGLPLAVPTSTMAVEAIAHRDGIWVTAGTGLDADGVPTARAWWSDDGRRWQDATVPDGVDVAIRTVGASGDGFVLVGVHDVDDRAVVWTSPDGRAWSSLTSPLLQGESGGVLQIESVLARPDGALLAGFGFDGRVIAPYVLHVEGTSVTQAEVPALEGVPDSITLGLCDHDGTAFVTGVGQGDIGRMAWWQEDADGAWRAHPTDHPGGLWACASVGDRALGLGDMRPPGVGVVPLVDGDEPVALTGGERHTAEAMLTVGARVLVAGQSTDAAQDVSLWVGGVTDDPAAWERMLLPELAGPEAQRLAGAATDGSRTLLLVADGAAVRLVELRFAEGR